MIKLMADSTCDLSDDILKQYDISIAPLTVAMDGKTYKDRVDITADEFYSMMETLENPPSPPGLAFQGASHNGWMHWKNVSSDAAS